MLQVSLLSGMRNRMSDIAILLGTGAQCMYDILEDPIRHSLETEYGSTSSPIISGKIESRDIVLLFRHGTEHTIPPHKINYRANISAFKSFGIKKILALAAVGGITPEMSPGTIVLPDQIIDYTWGREHTFYDENVGHIDFTHPYDSHLRQKMCEASLITKIPIVQKGVYGAVQGPRLETAQEIRRMARDGCDLVGMTGMPEASLAREAELEYVCIAVVANWAAGVEDGIISMPHIRNTLSKSMQSVKSLVVEFLR